MQAITYALLTVIWIAGLQLVLRGAMQVWPVGLAGAYSRIISVVLLAGYLFITGNVWRRLRPGSAWSWLLLMGAVAIGINILWFWGQKLTTATNAALLLRLDLLFVVLIGTALGLERISIRGLLTIPVMLLGLVLLMEAHQLDWSKHLAGDLMIVGAAMGLATNAFIVRRILQQMDESSTAFYNILISMVGFAALASYERQAINQTSTEYTGAWLWLIAIGIIAAFATPIYYAALRRMMVWKLRAFLLLNPLIVALAEWLIWGHALNHLQWLGGGLIMIGVLLLICDEAKTSR